MKNSGYGVPGFYCFKTRRFSRTACDVIGAARWSIYMCDNRIRCVGCCLSGMQWLYKNAEYTYSCMIREYRPEYHISSQYYTSKRFVQFRRGVWIQNVTFQTFSSMFQLFRSNRSKVLYHHSFIVERCSYFWMVFYLHRLEPTFLKSSKESYRIWVL